MRWWVAGFGRVDESREAPAVTRRGAAAVTVLMAIVRTSFDMVVLFQNPKDVRNFMNFLRTVQSITFRAGATTCTLHRSQHLPP